jgi:Tol biopolymer transport system component
MGFFGALVDTTDGEGRVKARVAYGTVAGPARLAITVPEIGLVDTLEFDVRPGAPADVRIQPRDTVIRVGGTATLHGTVVDRFDNPRDGDIGYALVSGPGTLSGSTITATALGRIIVGATSGAAQDTAGVSVAPPGTLAVATAAGIYTAETDGTNRRAITARPADVLSWAPSGEEIVFDEGGTTSRIYIVDMTGTLRTPTSVVNSGGFELYPEFSPDGAWIYYSAHGGSPSLWRARANGTLTERVPIDVPEFDIWPSPAPLGDRLVYVRMTGGGGDYMRLLDLTNGDVTRIDVPGHSPRWSPAGDAIAFLYTRQTGWLHGPLMVMSPDGSNQREISTGGAHYRYGFSWSPDGKYVVATNVRTGLVDIIDVSTNVAIPLGHTTGARSVAWKP